MSLEQNRLKEAINNGSLQREQQRRKNADLRQRREAEKEIDYDENGRKIPRPRFLRPQDIAAGDEYDVERTLFTTLAGLSGLNLGANKEVAGFDSAAAGLAEAATSASADRAAMSTIEWCRSQALDIVAEVADTISDGTLAEDQLPSDLLDSLMLDAMDQDGEMDEDSDRLASALGEAIGDALSSLGVDDQTIEDIFSDDVTVADSALESAASTIIANMPDEGDALDEFVQEFIFGSPDDEPGFDSATGKKLTVGKNTTKKINGKTIRYKSVKATIVKEKTIARVTK